jgi:group I intron endonuclease
MKFYYIYKTINLIDGKFYIGKHESDKENDLYMGSGILLNRAIDKHGIDNFKKIILERCKNSEHLCEREIFWIEHENSYFPNGYNISKGGMGGDVYTNNPNRDEICKKQSEDQKLRYKENDVWRRNFSSSRLGKKHTEEAKLKMSTSKKGIIVFTEEHKKNIKDAAKKAWEKVKPYNAKKVDSYDLLENHLKTFDSIADASRFYNIASQNIWAVCKGHKKKYKGLIFKYSE